MRKVKGQSILGEDDFVEKLIGYVIGGKDIKEIPRRQRYVNRPGLKELFKEIQLREKQKRAEKIVQAVNEYGYSQKEVADYLGIHYSTISRLANK